MKFNVTGMSCAACSARVEKAVSSVNGVTSCSVNLLTNSMIVEGNVKNEDIIKAVELAGYGISDSIDNKENINNSFLKGKVNLILSIVFVLIIMYFSMGVNMFSAPLPSFLTNKYIVIAIIQMVFAFAVMVINKKFFINGFKGALKGAFNMDTLVSIGSGASFIYSVYLLFRMINGENHIHNLYFESAAMILALISVGKLLEEYSKGKTTNAIKSLIELKPETATLIIDNEEIVVPVEKVKISDVFIVKPGENISVDGIIIDGNTVIDESMLTGESIPVEKSINNKVYSGTINKSGYIKCRATNVGENTVLSKIIKTVTDATATKAPIAKTADKVAGIFVPIVIILALITGVCWFFVENNFSISFERAISVLVISCPCSLGLATPVAIMVGSGVGAKKGILFKSAAALEEAGRVNTIVFDKTGTLTNGTPNVTDIISNNNNLLKYAYSVEKMSEHPLAKAINNKAIKQNVTPYNVTDFVNHIGKGISCKIDGKVLRAGNLQFVNIPNEKEIEDLLQYLSEQGKTVLYFSLDGEYLGAIAVADTLKEDSIKTVEKLKKNGYNVYMLTGDNELTAKRIAKNVGIENVFAKVLPDEKAEIIKQLKQNGKVLMVGDGINDAPALAVADVSMAIGKGTDIAINSADIVLMNSNLTDVSNALFLSKKVLKNIKENLFWAFFYNSIGIPLAAGVFSSLLGWQLNPMIAAAAMSLSSICVVFNALRLNFVNFNKEKKKMKKTVKISGMMCPHCEARVKKLFESLPQVSEAEVSHKKGTAILTLNDALADDEIKTLVENEGYKVV